MDVREFEQNLHDLEVKMERLKALYEQWFQGMERLEPNVPRKDVERRLQALRRGLPRNTTLRFRFQQLVQRYTTYTAYWSRIARQIEEGTYRRDLLRARRIRQQARQDRIPSRRGEVEELEAIDLGDLLIEDDDDDMLDDMPTLPPPRK